MNSMGSLNYRLANNGLHQTARGGVAVASRRRPVVDARPAGEAGCYPDAGARTRSGETLALALLLVAIGSACSLDPCGNDALGGYESPDGQKEAIVFLRDCGATTAESIHVFIASRASREKGSRWSTATQGNALVLEDSDVEAQWLGSDRLVLMYQPGAKVFKKESPVEGVVIEYREKHPN